MANTTQPNYLVRGTVPSDPQPGNSQAQGAVNGRLDLLVAPSLPMKSELARLGNDWTCTLATGSAFTHVAGWPTTLSGLMLWNGEPTGGKSYVIGSAFVAAITSIAAASAYTLLGQIIGSVAAPTNDALQLIVSRSGKANYGGNAKRAAAQTSAVANKWEVLNSVPAGPAASIGLATFADLYGGWIVPPGGAFYINAVAGTAAGTAVCGFTWSEVQLSLG